MELLKIWALARVPSLCMKLLIVLGNFPSEIAFEACAMLNAIPMSISLLQLILLKLNNWRVFLPSLHKYGVVSSNHFHNGLRASLCL